MLTRISKQLESAKPWENPAHKIAMEIVAMQERGASWAEIQAIEAQIDTALSSGRNESSAIGKALATLEDAEAIPAQTIPVGF